MLLGKYSGESSTDRKLLIIDEIILGFGRSDEPVLHYIKFNKRKTFSSLFLEIFIFL